MPPTEPHIWLTLGYRSVSQGDGLAAIEWDATPEFCFHGPSGPIVHGGMVTTLYQRNERILGTRWARLSVVAIAIALVIAAVLAFGTR